MHDERKWPLSALLLRGRSTLARRVAERRRPGQRQHIEIELPGPVLPGILRERQSGGQHHGKDDGKRRTNEKQRTRPGHAITPSLNWTHQVSRISARPGTLQEQNSNQRRAELTDIYCHITAELRSGSRVPQTCCLSMIF